MNNLQIITALCLLISMCANLAFLLIIYPTLKMALAENDDDAFKTTTELMFVIYNANKPILLRKFKIIDLFITYGGVVYYLLFSVIIIYYAYIKSNNISYIILYTVATLVLYKILMGILKEISLKIYNLPYIFAALIPISIIANMLLIIYSITEFV